MQHTENNTVSLLKELYNPFLCAGKDFREKVCAELKIKEGVFYSRMNTYQHLTLSYADEKKVIRIAENIVTELSHLVKVQKGTQNPSKGVLKVDK